MFGADFLVIPDADPAGDGKPVTGAVVQLRTGELVLLPAPGLGVADGNLQE